MINLKTVQQYRGTILLLVVLLIGSAISGIVWLAGNNQRTQAPPLAPQALPPTAPFSSADPETLAIAWDKIRIGIDRAEIDKILQSEREENLGNNSTTVFYKSTTPYTNHKIIYENNKAVQIERFVNERKEKITPQFYRTLYGRGDVLRPGEGNIWQLEAFEISNNEYVVIEFDTSYNQTYKIFNLNQERYRQFRLNNVNQYTEFYSEDDAI